VYYGRAEYDKNIEYWSNISCQRYKGNYEDCDDKLLDW
jgi:hypothetical protein